MKDRTLKSCPSRRDFLKISATVATAVSLAQLDPGRYAHAAGSDLIRVGMIGCGGRGTGAAVDAMDADPGVCLMAMGDLFIDRVREKRTLLQEQKPSQVMVDDDHCFAGFDAYRSVIESVDVVLIANAAKFHPFHLKAAIEAGKHVFVEKPHGIDPAGIQKLRAGCELAKKKKLSVVSGLQSRYHPGYCETIQRLHDGAIGEIVAIEENFLRAPYGIYARKEGLNEVQYQYSNQYHFHWLSGDDVVQSLVHNLDRSTWVLREQPPLKAHGLGGRASLFGEIYGNVFDHHSVVYQYANGVRLYAFCRTAEGCYEENSSLILGAKGRCQLMKMQIEGEKPWQYSGPNANPYKLEHQALFKAIRSGTPINNGDYMVQSTLVSIMGQISCYTGKAIAWDQIYRSDFAYGPEPEDCNFNLDPPVQPDAHKLYPVFIPGRTQLL